VTRTPRARAKARPLNYAFGVMDRAIVTLRRTTLAAVLLFLSVQSVIGAGIDCSRAATSQEKLICEDPRVLVLDERLSGLYALGLQIVRQVDMLRREQGSWLKDVRDACSDATCLVSVYQGRIDALLALLNRHTIPLASSLSVEKKYPVPDASPMCKGAEDGGFFSIALKIDGRRVTGTLDGVYNCGYGTGARLNSPHYYWAIWLKLNSMVGTLSGHRRGPSLRSQKHMPTGIHSKL